MKLELKWEMERAFEIGLSCAGRKSCGRRMLPSPSPRPSPGRIGRGFTGDQNTHTGNSFVFSDYATSTSNSDGSLPLTPALSGTEIGHGNSALTLPSPPGEGDGERENCAPISLQNIALSCS